MGTNELFCGNNPRLIEHKIIEFINVLRERGLAFHAIVTTFTVLWHFTR